MNIYEPPSFGKRQFRFHNVILSVTADWAFVDQVLSYLSHLHDPLIVEVYVREESYGVQHEGFASKITVVSREEYGGLA